MHLVLLVVLRLVVMPRQRQLQIGLTGPYLCHDPQVKKTGRLRKVVDETTQVRCAVGKGVVREEVWQDSRGVAVKYNLAFINHALCAKDNGRVGGYDNNHGDHLRQGSVELPLTRY